MDEYSLDVACINADTFYGRIFDSFSEKLHGIRDQSLLQLKFLEFFFLKSVLVGLLKVPSDYDVSGFIGACSVAELAIRERLRVARMRLLDGISIR